MLSRCKQDRPPYWEVVTGDGRWWSVAHNQDTHRYLITNGAGRVLDEHGPTGQKVLDAVHSHERNARHEGSSMTDTAITGARKALT